jgi:hypothetical protein
VFTPTKEAIAMHQALILWAAVVGVDVGWQPVSGGGYEYIIQIEPEMLESLREGQEIESDIPHFLQDSDPAEGAEQPSPPESASDPERPGRYAPFGSELDERPALDRPAEGQDEVASEEPPETFVADDGTLPIVNQAGYRDDGATEGSAEDEPDAQAAGPQPAAAADTEDGSRPWLPFTLALLGLFASLGGNCYLGLLTWGFRGRYLQLLEEHKWRRKQSIKDDDESDSPD